VKRFLFFIFIFGILALLFTGCPTVPLIAPTNLTIIAHTINSATLSWIDNSTNETGFKIYRKVDGGTFSLFQTVAANTTTWLNTGLATGHTYYYHVTAYNDKGESASSNEVSYYPYSVVISDDFESYAVGNSANVLPWCTYTQTGTSYSRITANGKTGKGLYFYDPVDSDYVSLEKLWGSLVKGQIEFDVKILSGSTGFGVRTYPQFSTPYFSVYDPGTGLAFYAYEGGSFTKLRDFTFGVWYHVRMIFDLTTNSYTVFVNGVNEGSFNTASNDTTGLRILAFSDTVGFIYFDNLVVKNFGTYIPAPALSDNGDFSSASE
jgi:hypothetical protein